VQLKSENSIN